MNQYILHGQYGHLTMLAVALCWWVETERNQVSGRSGEEIKYDGINGLAQHYGNSGASAMELPVH